VWWTGYSVIVGGGLLVAAIARRRVTEPYLGLSLALLLLLLLGWLLQPRAALYATLFLTAVSDQVTVWWFPFAKNLSSRESISYVHDGLPLTPIELMLVVTVVAWLLRSYATHTWRIQRGGVLWPALLFEGFLVIGLMRGILGGGDIRIAMFESRAMFYLPTLYFLIVQLFTTRAQYVRLFVVAVVAIFGQSLLAIVYFAGLGAEQRSELDRLTEHSSSIHLGAVFVVLMASFLLPGCTVRLRSALLVVSVPGLIVFALSQRRSAAVGLCIAVILLVVVVAKLRPSTLIWLLPTGALVSAAYLAVFWNTIGPVGLGAQAVKSVIAPDQLDNVDRSSDMYRQIEAYNLWYTIRAQPITGVGFGNPFYQPAPLPFLEGFEFRAFIPHNSMIWVWLKLGVAGFVTVLAVILLSIAAAYGVAALGVPLGLAFVIVAVVYLLVAGIAAFVGIKALKTIKPPERTIRAAKETAALVTSEGRAEAARG